MTKKLAGVIAGMEVHLLDWVCRQYWFRLRPAGPAAITPSDGGHRDPKQLKHMGLAVLGLGLLIGICLALDMACRRGSDRALPPSRTPVLSARNGRIVLSDNVLVELTAVGSGTAWWRTDGTLLPARTVPASASAELDPCRRILALRTGRLPSGATVHWNMSGIGQRINSDPAGRTGDGLFRATVRTTTPRQGHIDIQVGIARGPWRTVRRMGRGDSDSLAAPSATKCAAIPVSRERHGKTEIIRFYETASDKVIRVIAMDRDGRVHEAAERQETAVPHAGYRYSRWSFVDPTGRIAEYRVQVRPVQWVEFRDVSLHPMAHAPTLLARR